MSMQKEEKISTFQLELSFIVNPEIKKFVEIILENVPDYFFTIPASSTGKYHPSYTQGVGGLVKHTQAAVRIVTELFHMHDDTSDELSNDDKDIVIASLILHDTVKNGMGTSKYTDAKHPLCAIKLIEDCVNTDEQLESIKDIFFESETAIKLFGCIKSHMGKWNMDYKTKAVVLPTPQTRLEHLVHLADYIASRKCLEFNFNV